MKKVLASVLAGSMVLGMASMASAAHSVGLEKGLGSDREYDLPLYFADGLYVTEDNGEEQITWSPQTQAAYEAYVEAYEEYKPYSKNYKSFVNDYLYSFTSAESGRAGKTVIDYYNEFYSEVTADSNPDVRPFANTLTASTRGNFMGGTLFRATPSDVEYVNGAGSAPYDSTSTLSAVIGEIEGVSPSNIEAELRTRHLITYVTDSNSIISGNGEYAPHKSSWDISDPDTTNYVTNMYTYGDDDVKEVRVKVWVKHGDNIRADVNKGKVSVSKKLIEKNWVDENDRTSDMDAYLFTLKAKADVRDFDLDDFEIEFDVENDKTYFLKGQVAYSDYREVNPGDRLAVTKSNRLDDQEDGCIFEFGEPLDEEVRIRANDYVDLFFKGNYGTDKENLRVMNDDITEVEEFFQDYDIDYYDFIGTPKFAKDVTARIDADSDSYIYEYDKKTGDVVDITDACEYTSDGWEFKRKTFKTYVILEEPYEGGNVKAEKEPVAEEPEDEPEETEEPKDDPSSEGSKPNPGTGAYPLF